jgi:hypothetical protein
MPLHRLPKRRSAVGFESGWTVFCFVRLLPRSTDAQNLRVRKGSRVALANTRKSWEEPTCKS